MGPCIGQVTATCTDRFAGRVMSAPCIERVLTGDIAEVVSFVTEARAQMFSTRAAGGMPADLAAFEAVYLQGDGCFLVARDNGRLVASIGYTPYDHRFPQLDYRGLKAVEVARLFVMPDYRRGGLASRLYGALEGRARAAQVALMYLHTHPFLPGAVDFWRRQGFTLTDIEHDPVWHTTHMERRLLRAT